MEVRFSNVSLSADVDVVDEGDDTLKCDLPSLLKSIKRCMANLAAKKNRVVRKEILKNVSGSFTPGTMTLVLGHHGSGKSALMKVLSGCFPKATNITIDGDILYNGVEQHEIRKRLPQIIAYVDQRDKHFPELTVRETLEFARTFCGGEPPRAMGALLSKGNLRESTEALVTSHARFERSTDAVIQQLRLETCQDTIVGDAMQRGISGGERKRVTIGEMEFGMKSVTLMDEISTGLDSAATYDIIASQRNIAKTQNKTVVIALLQPSPEVFALFDDVLILNEGEVMYHGSYGQVVGYFEHLGFVCPPERDIADYLLDLGTTQQHKYEVKTPTNSIRHPRYASEFAEIFRRSAICTETLQPIDAPLSPGRLATTKQHIESMPEFRQSFIASTTTLLRRQLVIQSRNKAFIISRVVMDVVMGLLNSTTFFQFDPKQVQVVMGITFGSIMFMALAQFPQVPTFFAARDVFYKQRRANLFRTSSYVLANTASLVPMILVETVIFGSLVYWVGGYASEAGAFVVFEVVAALANLVFAAWFFFLAAVCPNNNVATPVSLLSVAATIIFSGFIVVRNSIPDYFIWIYWLNPASWALRAMAANQYRSSKLDVCEYDGVNYCAKSGGKTMGEYYLSLFDVDSDKFWISLAIIVMAAMLVLFLVLTYVALEYKRYEAVESVVRSKADKKLEDRYALAPTPKSSHRGSGAVHSLISSDVVLEVKAKPSMQFTPVTLAFKDLWYTVQVPSKLKDESVDLLKGVTGYALPGTMTALMGSSGAGKTTLMDVIAGRKTGGTIQGQILLNGHEATDQAMRRCAGYCEQMDIHSQASTIREALTFSAFLRQDASVSNSAKRASVNECLELLNLHDIADQFVRSLSVEQMKRLTIGVELAAQPSVLFLDEPTSGLDARSAKLIMDGVRQVADTGRTVVCTIHQPSSEIFSLFDNLLLLKRDGEAVYFGDLENTLVGYFESIPCVAPLPKNYNPATWVLECIGAGVGNTVTDATDFAQIFTASELKQALDVVIAKEGVGRPAPSTVALTFAAKRAASSAVQMNFVVGRFVSLYWRTPSYNLTRCVMVTMLALLLGLIFIGAEHDSYQGVNSGLGTLFIMVLMTGFIAFSSVIPILSQERPSYYRECASQTYNTFWYIVGLTVAEIPYTFLAALLFSVVFCFMIGIHGTVTIALFWLNLALMMLMLTYMGQLFAYALPSQEVAAVLGLLAINILTRFMGFSPPASAIPSGYQWLYKLTPQRYSLAIAAALVFADCSTTPIFDASTATWTNVGPELGCQPLRNSPPDIGATTVKEFVETVFLMEHESIPTNFGSVVCFIVAFKILGGLATRYINHQKK